MAEMYTYKSTQLADAPESQLATPNSTSNQSSGGFSWNSLNGLLGTLGQTAVGLFGNAPTTQTNTPVIVQPQTRNNTGLIVGIVAGALVLFTVLFFVLRKKK